MSQMYNELAANCLVGLTRDQGLQWWFHHGGGEMGVNTFEDGVPIDLAREYVERCTPEKRQVALLNEDGTIDKVLEDRVAAYIPHFGNCSYIGQKGFQVHPPVELIFDPLAALCVDGIELKSVVISRGGALVSVQLSTPDVREVAGMKFYSSIFGATAHDGSLATMYKATTTKIVCDNTQAAAIAGNGDEFRFKHTSNSLLAVEGAGAVLEQLEGIADSMGYKIEKLASVKVSRYQFDKWLNIFAPDPKEVKAEADAKAKRSRALTIARNKRNEIAELYEADNRVTPWAGTALGVMQAANTYQYHVAPVRGADRITRQIDNLWNGKQESLDALAMKQLQCVLA